MKRRRIRAMRVVALCAAALSLARCGGSGDPPRSDADGGTPEGGAGGTPGGDVSCVEDARVDAYAPGMRKFGARGALTFELSGSEPAPPAKGPNRFELRLTDAEGELASGLLVVDLFMPDHGHGTSVTPVVTFDEGSGSYTVDPVYLFMPGVWRVELSLFDAESEDELVDRAELYFCVEG